MPLVLLALGACTQPSHTGPQAAPGQSQAQPKPFADWFSVPKAKDASQSGPSDVMKMVCFYRPTPFLSFDRAGDPDPEGFTFTFYLISRQTSKGIHESGTINVRMFRAGSRAAGERSLIREWTVQTDELPRSAKPHPLLGMGYQPQFAWEKTDDVLGHDVEVITTFTARDGRNIQSQTKALRVPAHKG